MSGAMKDYEFAEKDEWRKVMWNRIAHRVAKAPRRCLVVGLFGAKGLDIDIATSRRLGFRRENFVNVESDPAAVERARGNGINTIRGELATVVALWGEPRIDVVIADFCGGLSSRTILTMRDISVTPSLADRAVVLVNVLRGRDRLVRRIQHNRVFSSGVTIDGQTVDPRNRAAYIHDESIAVRCGALEFSDLKTFGPRQLPGDHLVASRGDRPFYRSYKSGRLVFDSVLWSFQAGPRPRAIYDDDLPPRARRIKRRIAAAKAVRSARLAE